MPERLRISAFGTAKQLFFGHRGLPEEDRESEIKTLVNQLMERVRLFNLDEEMVQLALEMVLWQKDLRPEEIKALLVISVASLILLQQGSTRMPLFDDGADDYLEGIIVALLDDGFQRGTGALRPAARGVLDLARKLIVSEKCSAFIGRIDDYKPLIVADSSLYHHKLRRLEERFTHRLRELLSVHVKLFDTDSVKSCLSKVDGTPFVLSGEQRSAVIAAVSNPFTIISGGPGTGKTSVIVTILRVLLALGAKIEEIALAAPTGKAANRMAESIQNAISGLDGEAGQLIDIPTRTLHRLLGYSPSTGRFHCNENNRLTERFVFVDEGSMIDLFLMERLIRSLREDARLILLGDADQLPSVEAGAVFRDLIFGTSADATPPPDPPYVVKLLMSHRMDEKDSSGRHILSVAKLIRSEDAGSLFCEDNPDRLIRRGAISDIVFDKVEFIDIGSQRSRLDEFLNYWHQSQIANLERFDALIKKSYGIGNDGFWKQDISDIAALYEHLNASKILCLTRVYPTGAEATNRYFHRRFLEGGGYRYFPEFVPGESVMMLHNDYERNIFNGDQGIVLRAHEKTGRSLLVAAFKRPAGFAAFPVSALRASLEHSFAITVHKSQGSEFIHTAVLLPHQDLPILRREILYTAITRSRKSVVLAGNKDMVSLGMSRKLMRYSGIASLMNARY